MRHSVAIAAWLLSVAACGRLDFGARARDGAIVAGDGANPDGDDGDAAGGCLASYLLCDGFETASLASWWIPTQTGVDLDTTVAHRGAQSLHLHVDDVAAGDGANAVVTEMTTFAGSPSATFYVRAFVRISAVPVDNLGLIEADQTNLAPKGDGVFETPTGLTVYSQFAEQTSDANFTPPDGAWTCVVWTVDRATDMSGSLVLGGDGSATLAGVQTDGDPAIDEMELGIQFASSTDTAMQPAIDMWLDDVIVSATPLDCSD